MATIHITKREAETLDPLGASTPLPHRKVVYPYGFPALIKTNEPKVFEHVEFSWGRCAKRFREMPVELRIVVTEHASVEVSPIPAYRSQANLLTVVSDAANHGCCDLATSRGFANLTRTTIERGDYFRYNFLEGMIYSLLDTKYLATMHAACVARNNCGILLAGASGAGKSSFAYACGLRGWTYVSDDASALVIKNRNHTVVGNPYSIRFRPSISSLFSELKGHVKDRNGKPTLEIRTEQFSHFKVAHQCRVNYVVFLRRNDNDADPETLVPLSRAERLRRILYNPWSPELPVFQERMVAITRLADVPAYELSYRDFDRAIYRLERLLDKGTPRG